ncbi:MAG: SDR family NAD(P)-dependent oxidoreductase, partial [Planctomycetota bacterium]|nr:SDR family NAD(P)-dependent oxidoreductase [Planctomycetota bacterium]
MTTANDPPDKDSLELEDSTEDVDSTEEPADTAGETGETEDITGDSGATAPKTTLRSRSGKLHSNKPVAVVTGAARRVGREIALAMAERGLGVVVHHGTSSVEANVLVNRIRSQGGTAVAVSADLRDPRAAAMAVFEAAVEIGEVTTLINCAAVFQNRALPWIDLYHCNVHLSVNLLAPIFLSQQFIRQLGEG